MDPFTEKEIVDCLKSIAISLRNMDAKMDELTLAVREIGLGLEDAEAEDEESDDEQAA